MTQDEDEDIIAITEPQPVQHNVRRRENHLPLASGAGVAGPSTCDPDSVWGRQRMTRSRRLEVQRSSPEKLAREPVKLGHRDEQDYGEDVLPIYQSTSRHSVTERDPTLNVLYTPAAYNHAESTNDSAQRTQHRVQSHFGSQSPTKRPQVSRVVGLGRPIDGSSTESEKDDILPPESFDTDRPQVHNIDSGSDEELVSRGHSPTKKQAPRASVLAFTGRGKRPMRMKNGDSVSILVCLV